MGAYYAGIQQSRETVTRFSRVQFNIFKSKTKWAIICFCMGLLIIGFALLSSYKALAVVLVFIACIIYANQDAGADYTANMVINMFNGSFPKLRYCFSPTGYTVVGNEKEMKYNTVIRLVEDEDYLYVFQTEQYGIMIKSSTVNGEGGLQGFKDFLSQKTKLNWTKQNRILTSGFGISKRKGKAGFTLGGKEKLTISEVLFGKQNK